TAGRWPWRSAAAKKCVATFLPNPCALKKEGAGSPPDAVPHFGLLFFYVCVVGRRGRREAARRRAVERPRAQILEGVAGLAPRADEEKGFREERAGPKARSVRGEGEERAPRALRQRRGRLDARGARGAERHLC
ncbi:hypothetical protein NEPAR07_2513, partial [Nematocida parisii]